MTPNNHNGIANHEAQSREFLTKSRQYLAAGDLHQASEKGWGAAAHMAKAVSLAQGWQYNRHSQFHRLMNQGGQATGNPRLRHLHGRAEILHINFYDLKTELSRDIDDMAEWYCSTCWVVPSLPAEARIAPAVAGLNRSRRG